MGKFMKKLAALALVIVFCPSGSAARNAIDVDYDLSGVVDFADFLIFARAWNEEDMSIDLDDDGVVDFSDFLVFSRFFGQAAAIPFADPNLEAAVRNHIDKQTGPILRSDVANLTGLGARFAGITDLDGIQYLSALKHLTLSGNRITDISTLSGLTRLRW